MGGREEGRGKGGRREEGEERMKEGSITDAVQSSPITQKVTFVSHHPCSLWLPGFQQQSFECPHRCLGVEEHGHLRVTGVGSQEG